MKISFHVNTYLLSSYEMKSCKHYDLIIFPEFKSKPIEYSLKNYKYEEFKVLLI
jgi:hypothetical protein